MPALITGKALFKTHTMLSLCGERLKHTGAYAADRDELRDNEHEPT